MWSKRWLLKIEPMQVQKLIFCQIYKNLEVQMSSGGLWRMMQNAYDRVFMAEMETDAATRNAVHI